MSPPRATFRSERSLWEGGLEFVAGVDEVGCGCWAGPVYAAAVILKKDGRLDDIRDSKTLSESQRTSYALVIERRAVTFAVASATVEEIDRLNIRRAAALAMQRAILQLSPLPQHLLIDAFRLPALAIPQTPIIRGDARVKSIAAASILAKVARDRFMTELDQQFPGYGFARHKGYGTKEHQNALQQLGVSAAHRQTYRPISFFLRKAKG